MYQRQIYWQHLSIVLLSNLLIIVHLEIDFLPRMRAGPLIKIAPLYNQGLRIFSNGVLACNDMAGNFHSRIDGFFQIGMEHILLLIRNTILHVAVGTILNPRIIYYKGSGILRNSIVIWQFVGYGLPDARSASRASGRLGRAMRRIPAAS